MRYRQSEGFSLIEVLVAITIFAILIVAALNVYDQSQRAYVMGEQMSDQQQTVRIAFQKMSADLKLTGWNFNPDGDKFRPDEQVEGIWDRAIVIRADFDDFRENNDKTDPATNPNNLESALWPVVTTGNHEIVAYVLRSDSGEAGANANSITFYADIVGEHDVKRDAEFTSTPPIIPDKQETVRIDGIDLTGDHPPYTLYRVSVKSAKDLAGNTQISPCDGCLIKGSPQNQEDLDFTPLAGNIRDMVFTYYDTIGNVKDPEAWATTNWGPLDIQGNETLMFSGNLTVLPRDIRSGRPAITRDALKTIKVDLKGMVSQPDPLFVDGGDSNETFQHFRKYLLSSTVQLTNLGMIPKKVGKEGAMEEPINPTGLAAIPGHCNGIILTWTLPADTSNNTAYEIKVDGNSTIVYHLAYGSGTWFTYVPNLVNTNYTFTIRAINPDHTETDWGPSTSATPVPDGSHHPGMPTMVSASVKVDVNEYVHVTWSNPPQDEAGYQMDADPEIPIPLRDQKGSKVFRQVYDDGRILEFDVPNPDDPNSPGPGIELVATSDDVQVSRNYFQDFTTVPCEDYCYRIFAENFCGDEGPISEAMLDWVTAPQPTGAIPLAPNNLLPLEVTETTTDNYKIVLWWERVTQTNLSTEARVRWYEVLINDAPTSATNPSFIESVMIEDSAMTGDSDNKVEGNLGTRLIMPGEHYYFRVRAVWSCSPAVASPWSEEIVIPCVPEWTADVINPVEGASVQGLVNIQTRITGAMNPIQSVKISIKSNADNAIIMPTTPATYDSMDDAWELPWDTSVIWGGWYTIHVTILDSLGCILELDRQVQVIQLCDVLVISEGICASDPRAVCFTILAPQDGMEYFIDSLDLTGTTNYMLQTLTGFDDSTWFLYTDPAGTVIPVGGLPIGHDLTDPSDLTPPFNHTNFEKEFFHLSRLPARETKYRATFNGIIGNSGPLDLYLGTLNLKKNVTYDYGCMTGTASVTFTKYNQNTWEPLGYAPIDDGTFCVRPLVYLDGNLLSEGIDYQIDYTNGAIEWIPFIKYPPPAQIYPLTIEYQYADPHYYWDEEVVCTNLQLLAGP